MWIHLLATGLVNGAGGTPADLSCGNILLMDGTPLLLMDDTPMLVMTGACPQTQVSSGGEYTAPDMHHLARLRRRRREEEEFLVIA